MSRLVVDAGVVLYLLGEELTVPAEVQLMAPTLIRSQVLSALYESVQRGEISEDVGLDRLARFGKMRIRYLGDAVLRRVAWAVAHQLGWESTLEAEYVALTRLQADALVTMDHELARSVEGVVEIAPIDSVL